jgi:transaldolase
VAVWLDDISHDRLASGSLAELVRTRHVTGVTSNPTIFANALSNGTAYDKQLAELAARGATAEEAARLITARDIRAACSVLRPVYDKTCGADGQVSLEVDPRIACDPVRTVAEARDLWRTVNRPNLLIKIPATAEGGLRRPGTLRNPIRRRHSRPGRRRARQVLGLMDRTTGHHPPRTRTRGIIRPYPGAASCR